MLLCYGSKYNLAAAPNVCRRQEEITIQVFVLFRGRSETWDLSDKKGGVGWVMAVEGAGVGQLDKCLMELVRVFAGRHPCADQGLRVTGTLEVH